MDNNHVELGDVAEKIRKVASKSNNEEDIKIAIEGIFDEILPVLGIERDPKYEVPLWKGRADAVYRGVIIEYKRPNGLKQKNIREDAIKKIGGYLKGMSGGNKVSRKFVGVAIDGFNILFVRAPRQKVEEKEESPLKIKQLTLNGTTAGITSVINWDVSKVHPITKETIETLFLYFHSLSHKILTPENLAEDFGHKSDIARKAIHILSNKLSTVKNPKMEILYSEWNRIFGIVYGVELSKVEPHLTELAESYEFNGELRRLFFAIHTYYVILMKMLAAELLSLQAGSIFTSFITELSLLEPNELKKKMKDLESEGGFFKRYGIINFLEGDFFGWYIDIFDEDIASFVKDMARKLEDYEPATTFLEPDYTKDLLKKLYQYLVPKGLRHDLGEYYTPDWLAELLINEIGYDGELDNRVLDPACGSGTFLTLLINKIKERIDRYPEEYPNRRKVLDSILENIVGFDINPLAVISSRTNYLLALGADLVRYRGSEGVRIPVYLCDSILISKRYPVVYGTRHLIKTAVGDFYLSEDFAQKEYIEILVSRLEELIPLKAKPENFLDRLKDDIPENLLNNSKKDLTELYAKILDLELKNQNRIWARIIKNSFAPAFVGKFDYIIGNPPWIRWGYLSEDYRNATLDMWKDYGLFSLKGMEARLGSGEKDFSMLFTYACADFYLKDGGKLGFIITQEVVKAKGAGEGFRRFKIGNRVPLKVLQVQDLVSINPFEGAANKTAMLILLKGEETTYPIPYIKWEKEKHVPTEMELSEVFEITRRSKLVATPVGSKLTNPWLTVEAQVASIISKLSGKSYYLGRIGARVEPYGIFWLKVKHVRPDGKIIVENLPELGKKEIKKIEAVIEPDLVYPLLRGKDIKRWYKNFEIFSVISQDPKARQGYDEEWMRKKLLHTYKYLMEMKNLLLDRQNYWKYYSKDIKSERPIPDKKLSDKCKYHRFVGEREENGKKYYVYQCSNAPPYTMFNISDYTFDPFKVVWKRMSNDIMAAVISTVNTQLGEKILVPTDTTSFVGLQNEDEAHYLCSILNSSPCRCFVKSFSSAGRGFGAPSILKYIKVPKFNHQNQDHKRLAEFSKKAHKYATEGDKEKLKKIEEKIDNIARQIWGISKDELAKIIHK